jgi:hypothetical protein
VLARIAGLALATALGAACGAASSGQRDAGPASTDAAASPLDAATDAGSLPSLDAAPLDGGPSEAGSTPVDASGSIDAAPSDAAPSDAAPSDAAPSDAAPSDAAPSDAAPSDAAPSDATPSDAAPSDAAAAVQTGLTITPTSASAVSMNGSTPSLRFQVAAHYSDGRIVPVAAPTMQLEPPILGTPSGSNVTVSGRYGGAGTLTASFGGLSAVAAIQVRLVEQVVLPGTPNGAPALFGGPLLSDPTQEAKLLYPLDRAVMPQNLPPAEVQWSRSAAGDVFRVTLQKPSVTAILFESTATPGYRDSWLVDLTTWRRLAQSDPTDWVTITVDRWIAATQQAVAGTPVQVRFAQAALEGSVYYQEPATMQLNRIDDGTSRREVFMPTPPLGCAGCHSVSPSGRYLAPRFGGGDNPGSVVDLTQDLTGNPPPLLFPATENWEFSSFSPDERRLVVSVGELGGAARQLKLVDAMAGGFVVPLAGALPVGPVTHPAWAPDGSAIAYVDHTNAWGGNTSTGDLRLLDVLGPDRFGSTHLVVSGTSALGLPAGLVLSYPTWSPDAAWLAFGHGTLSRSENGQGALYAVRRDRSGLVRLTEASGGAGGNTSFQPRFSPFTADGYHWLAFVSRRDYGNSLAGTLGSGRQQIWVAAIKADPAPGEDPSEVAYWLPGQDTASVNLQAFWAARACRAVAESCQTDADCCSANCAAGAMGRSCAPQLACKAVGTACSWNAECCDGQFCLDGSCGGL